VRALVAGAAGLGCWSPRIPFAEGVARTIEYFKGIIGYSSEGARCEL
jgi:hypothetical protein